MKAHKTNAARILDSMEIRYTLQPYDVDESDLSAAHMAAVLGLELERVFKTLVLKGETTGYFVCIIPGGEELDLKKAARCSGNKSCAMLPLKELQPVTGYVRGGCSPLGMKKRFPTFLDESAILFEGIHVSAGQRGLQLLVRPGDLLRAVPAVLADITAAHTAKHG